MCHYEESHLHEMPTPLYMPIFSALCVKKHMDKVGVDIGNLYCATGIEYERLSQFLGGSMWIVLSFPEQKTIANAFGMNPNDFYDTPTWVR